MKNTITTKSFFNLLFLLLGLGTINAQTAKSFYLEFGGAVTNFQDVKYSKVPYSGGGLALNFGYEKEIDQVIWNTGLNLRGSFESAKTFDNKAWAINPTIQFKYLRKISDQFAIGVNWNVLGLYLRNAADLGNNSIYFVASSDLMASAQYRRNKFDFGLDVGLLTWVKESTGFAFSASQNILEDGLFDYQNERLEDPFGFKYYQLKSGFKHLLVQTHIDYMVSDRFELGYQWSARHFSEVKNYPVTIGSHTLTMRWNLSKKTRGMEGNKF